MRTLLIATLLLTTAFAQSATKKAASPSADRATVEKLNRAFEAAAAKKDSAAIGQMYHSQAHMLGGDMPAVAGREAIQKAWQSFFDMNMTDLKLITDSVERHGDILVEIGHYTDTFGGKPDKGKYVVLYKKEGGAWKLWVDSFSGDAPPKQ
jgi:ketosteroid isomerase-like protein